MEEEAFKRLKIHETTDKTHIMDCEALVLTTIQFLTEYEVVCYLAVNKELQTYDNRILWDRVKPTWSSIAKRSIKKCIHFDRLIHRYTLPQLIDECTNTYQLNLLRLYINMTTPRGNVRETIKTMICMLTPKFLKKQLVWRPHYTHWPSNQPHKKIMEIESLHDLRESILEKDKRINKRIKQWERLGAIQ